MAERDRQQRIKLMEANYHHVDRTAFYAWSAGMPLETTVIIVTDVSDPLGAAFCTGLKESIEKVKEEAAQANEPVPLGLFAINLTVVSLLLAAINAIEDSHGILVPPPSADMVRTLTVAFGGMTRGYVEVRPPGAV